MKRGIYKLTRTIENPGKTHNRSTVWYAQPIWQRGTEFASCFGVLRQLTQLEEIRFFEHLWDGPNERLAINSLREALPNVTLRNV